MADLFQCDHCGDVLKKHDKKGTLTLQEIDWRDGVPFPAPAKLVHDLCQRCLVKLKVAVGKVRALPEEI